MRTSEIVKKREALEQSVVHALREFKTRCDECVYDYSDAELLSLARRVVLDLEALIDFDAVEH